MANFDTKCRDKYQIPYYNKLKAPLMHRRAIQIPSQLSFRQSR
jgi:hypothetical protein